MDWAQRRRRRGPNREPPSLHVIAEGIDTSSAAGRMVANVLGSIAQWYREDLGEKMVRMHAAKRAAGERVGVPPFGFEVGPDGRARVPRRDEAEALRLVEDRVTAGLGPRRILGRLEAPRLPARDGGGWYLSKVRRVVDAVRAREGAT